MSEHLPDCPAEVGRGCKCPPDRVAVKRSIVDRFIAETDECKDLLEAAGIQRWTGRPLVEMVREAVAMLEARR